MLRLLPLCCRGGKKVNVQEKLAQLDAYFNDGKLAEAEQLLTSALQEAKNREEYGAALTFYNEMEGLYRTTGRAEEAALISEEALALIEKMGLNGSMPHGTTLLNGATANRVAGNPERALAMYHQAEQIFQAQGQERSYYMTALYNNISQVWQEQGEYERALAYQEKALAQIQTLRDSEAEMATTQVNMSLSLMALDRLTEAEEQLNAAFAYYESSLGKNDPHHSSALAAAGELACRRGGYEQAEAFFKQALQMTLNYYGENDACRVIRQNLAVVRERAAAAGPGTGA